MTDPGGAWVAGAPVAFGTIGAFQAECSRRLCASRRRGPQREMYP